MFISGAFAASILYKSTAGRDRPVSYPDGPITARYKFIKNAYCFFVVFFLAFARLFRVPRVTIVYHEEEYFPVKPLVYFRTHLPAFQVHTSVVA